MDPRLERLYATSPTLEPDYVRNVLNLSGEQAKCVDRITGGIHRDEAVLVTEVVACVDPEISLEVGLGYGFSAMAICTAGQRPKAERRHIIMDPHQSTYWGGVGLHHLAEAGFSDMIEVHQEPSHRTLPRLELDGLAVDFAFVDGWYTFDHVFVDFFYIDKLLKPGAAVMFDDADWPSVRKVLRYAVSNLGYEACATLPQKSDASAQDIELGLSGSCIAIRKPSSGLERDIFFHNDF